MATTLDETSLDIGPEPSSSEPPGPAASSPTLRGIPTPLRRSILSELDAVNRFADQLESYTDAELTDLYAELREEEAATAHPSERPLCFAVVREVAARTLGLRPYDEQVLAGLAIARGCIAEVATGEGKTLLATMPVAWWATSGRQVHVATANDYLAARDAAWMGQVYEALGLTTSVSLTATPRPETIEAYQADIVYSTAQQLGFDFLTDQLARSEDMIAQPDHFAALVDEADALLIDEARTALIISGPDNTPGDDLAAGIAWAKTLKPGTHYLVDWERRETVLTPKGVAYTEQYFDIPHLYTDPVLARITYVCLKAEVLYKLGREYIVAPLPSKSPAPATTHEAGRGAAGEDAAGEGATDQGKTSSADVDDTDMTNEEFERRMNAATPDRPPTDTDRPADPASWTSTPEPLAVILVDEHTGRALPDRRYQDGLHEALEAKENIPTLRRTITQSSITIPAFFARYENFGGMTGTAASDALELYTAYGTPVAVVPTHRPVIRIDHPDRLYLTTEAKLAALVEEVATRSAAGQPVLVGAPTVREAVAAAEVLAEAGLSFQLLSAQHHAAEAAIIAQAGRPGAITVATNMAGRGVDILLGGNAEALQAVLGDPDEGTWEEQCALDRAAVLEVGGLAVIGTARHDSRRVDNQLRGRAGRQGEPGESLFLLSCQDELIENFGGATMSSLLTRLGMDDTSAPVTAPAFTKLVTRCQRKVEDHYAEGRQSLRDFDRIIASQREAFWSWRAGLLTDTFEELIDRLVDTALAPVFNPPRPISPTHTLHRQPPVTLTLAELTARLASFYPFPLPAVVTADYPERPGPTGESPTTDSDTTDSDTTDSATDLTTGAPSDAADHATTGEDASEEDAEATEDQGVIEKRGVVEDPAEGWEDGLDEEWPIDPDVAHLAIAADLRARLTARFDEVAESKKDVALRALYLSHMDTAWTRHLQDLEVVQKAIQLRSYANADPKVAFALESSDLLRHHLVESHRRAIAQLWKLVIYLRNEAGERLDADGQVVNEDGSPLEVDAPRKESTPPAEDDDTPAETE